MAPRLWSCFSSSSSKASTTRGGGGGGAGFVDSLLQPSRPAPDSLQVFLRGALRTKVDNDGANILVALYENGLVTDCPRGENKGRVLSNDYVVRKLEKLCTVKDITAKKTVSGTEMEREV
ncbi:hypothetical protein JHK86_016658 [Glycine max]|nr:hypothetical protein JHK86_016658 [Glycine max]